MSGPMTPEQARDLFSDAYEGGLPEDVQRVFEAQLAADDALAAEYAAFRRALELVRQRPRVQSPNLLPGVRRRLRRRGRFYAGPLLERLGLGGVIHPVALGVLMLALLGLGWVALQLLEVVLGR